MGDSGDAPFPAIGRQGLILFVAIPEEEIVIPQDGRLDGRLMHLRGLGLHLERVFGPVERDPDEYLMRRQAPVVEQPRDREEFSGIDYLGVQQHLQEEELEAREQAADMDNEEEEEEFPENDDHGVQQDILDAPFPAIPGQGLTHSAAIPEVDRRLTNLHRLGVQAERVFEPVVLNPDEYLMQRQALVVEQPRDREEFSEMDYLGVQQHLQEEDLEAREQAVDMDNEEEDLDAEEKTMDCTKPASPDVDGKSSASQHVTKRDDPITDDCRLMKEIGSSSSSVATLGLQDSAMPGVASAAFVPILESATTSEVRTPKFNRPQDSAMPGVASAASVPILESTTTSETLNI